MSSSEVKYIKNTLINFSNYNFDKASEILLYQLLPFMDIHITENSVITIEAEAFNCPTILTHTSGRDLYNREISKGSAYYINDPQQIIDKILSLSIKKIKDDYKINLSTFEKKLLSIIG